ncbi:hypothetical protein AB833_05595 [Chromatiales bacterium (ex Bugula neritina AB1)]|nr:hypothetical protein AB833_05595 [Chromatiales bacterium (ex Bugula neritina AB1)]
MSPSAYDEIQAVIEHIDTAVFILELNESDEPTYVALNAFIRKRGKLSLSDSIGKTAKQLYPGKFGEMAYRYHCECFASGQAASYDLTAAIGGDELRVRTSLAPNLNSDGAVVRVVGTANIVEAEYLIREAQENTLALNAEIEHIIGLSAHDLRSPMRNMSQLTDLLLDGFVDLGDGKLALVNMLKLVSSATQSLIGNIVDFTQTSKAAESVERFQLLTVCREIFSILDPADNHRFDCDHVVLFGDKIATQITLRNLIDNAIKHNADKKIHVSVSAGAIADNVFEVVVSDDGQGLRNPEDLFSQKPPTKIDSGYGLYAVSRLIRSRGGQISASQKATGSGVEVRFSLPGRVE